MHLLCFSAPASFIAGSLLLFIGILSISVRRNNQTFFFRLIPILFGVQQFAEGFVWIALEAKKIDEWGLYFVYLFLFFAMVLWPIWVPFAIWKMEQNKKIKSILLFLVLFGAYQGIYLLYCMIMHPVHALVHNNHISYHIEYGKHPLVYNSAYYFVVTILPGIFSGERRMLIFTFLVALSFMISYVFFNDEMISVWCFFSALLSVFIYWNAPQIKANE